MMLRRLRPRHRAAVVAALVPCLLCAGGPGRAEPPDAAGSDPQATASVPASDAVKPAVVTVRGGSHDGYGRLVIAVPAGVRAQTSEADGKLVVRLPGAALRMAGKPPRNVEAMSADGGTLSLTLRPGAGWRSVLLGAKLIVDITDAGATGSPPLPAGASAPPSAARSKERATATPRPPSPPAPSRPAPSPLTPVAARPAPPQAAPSSQAVPPASDLAPTAVSAMPLPAPSSPVPSSPVPSSPVPSSPVPSSPVPSSPVPSSPAPSSPALPPPAPSSPRANPPAEASPPPPASAPALPAAAPAAPAAPPSPRTEIAETPQATPSIPAAPPRGGPVPAPGPAQPPAEAGPLALTASRSGEGMLLPFAETTGAAAFRAGDEAVVAFDERRPVDLAPLRDWPAYAGARIQLLPEATLLRLPLGAREVVRLTRLPKGWAVEKAGQTAAPPLQPIHPEIDAGRLLLPLSGAGRVVSVPDGDTGKALLVGTATQPGQGVAVARRTPEFRLLSSFQGVAVEPVSDGLSLHPSPTGFTLEQAAGQTLALDPFDEGKLAAADAAHLTRVWDFPALPNEALQRRLQAATAAAASAAPQSRTARRVAAVQAQLALGLGAEAHGLATFARAEDAAVADSPLESALDAVAALLAGRVQESAALDDPRVDGSDEIALWRAARRASLSEGAPDAASVFAATLPLILAYPQALRDRLLPLAAETMALGGEKVAARRLLDQRKDDPSLDLARAIMAQQDGRTEAALTLLDRLARSPDRKLRARAAMRAVELRLATGALTPCKAAEALDKLLYAWRGDAQELALRLRTAELQASCGGWRAALDLLRETADGDYAPPVPDLKARIHARMSEMFARALEADAHAALPPLELVALVEENPDLLPTDEAGQELAGRLVARLTALDLPRRADPLLAKLMAATPAGPVKAELGGRLADIKLQEGDANAALLALSASTATGLPSGLEERRTITFARANARRGAVPEALATLAALDTPAARDAQAALAEAAKDWPAAVRALGEIAARDVPAEGALSEAQGNVLLRLATAAAQAGDEALLARLREHDAPRLPAGRLADMLTLLTQKPVRGVADLPRAARETALARNLPTSLQAIPARASVQ